MTLENLPAEVLLNILSFLDPEQLVVIQLVSKHFFRLGRDDKLWKETCFEDSRFEAARRRRELLAAQEEQLVQLRQAVQELPGAFPLSPTESASSNPRHGLLTRLQRRERALANWDSSYPGECTDFYQEYVQRHGRVAVDWLEEPKERAATAVPEAMGVGTLTSDDGVVRRAVSPLEDGSLCIWEISPDHEPDSQGCVIARSPPGLLSMQPGSDGKLKSITNETGAIENVSVDSRQHRAYFAIHDNICQVDLNTLQLIHREPFSFPLSCLSSVDSFEPLTVGTTHTMHLYDPRQQTHHTSADSNVSQTAGMNTSLHSSLSEPGPLSILHRPLPSAPNEIWVAGRFKTLLSYDRRFWPRVSQTLFSGARLSSLSCLPYPFLDRSLDLMRNYNLSVSARAEAKTSPGATLLAAGEYRGKGSIELYNLSSSPTTPSTSHATAARHQNRQTASKTRLLSVTPHGTRLVFSDGDGALKWLERDGTTLVREFNINDYIHHQRGVGAATHPSAEIRTVYHDRDSGIGTPNSSSSDDGGEASALFAEGENGDIVQRIIPTRSPQNDLLIWTADGRLGIVGFGRGRGEGFGTGKTREGDGDEEEERREREAQLFGMRMRRALERQADEARFVRGLGLGGRWR